MKLERLLRKQDDGGEGWTTVQLAEAVRPFLPRGSRPTNPATIGRLCRESDRKETRTASLTLALAIERATAGKVRAEDLPLSREAKRLLRQLRDAQRGGGRDADAGAAA